jgi:CRISPR-associated endonuclease/helicase Cas3
VEVLNGCDFEKSFEVLTGFPPMRWQNRLYTEHFVAGKPLPSAVSIPTGLGKTAVMAVWLLALAEQLKAGGKPTLPRRLVYVVDRRAVVDQATKFAEDLYTNLQKDEARELRDALGLADVNLPISTLRGQFVDNREWLEDPARPAIIVGTVDMIGSRLLFEGYGVSHKMRPYHAGLLGADTLVLLDEAHLVPPFEVLLAEIAGNTGRYGAKDEALAALVPKFHLLSLSATGRRQTATPFALQEADFRNPDDAITVQRLTAKKYLILEQLGEDKLEDALAKKAWTLSDEGKKAVRVIVFCHERKIAEPIKDALEKLAKDKAIKDRIELFVGARRVRERKVAQMQLETLGFLPPPKKAADDKPPAARTLPSFLVATSAGEVGVDLDADHIVCDLVAWERMVQRFGRVNRRGGKDRSAKIIVIDEGEPKPKKPEQSTTEEKARIRIYQGVKQLIEKLRDEDKTEINVSPEALWHLSESARKDETLAKLIAEASSPAPLRPALNRALVDAWAMTSLPEHTGRPEVAPWLRGWVTDDPQTAVAWRKYLPVRDKPQVSTKEIEDFFEAAPLHASETLETESYRVQNWLLKRVRKINESTQEDKLKPDAVVAMLLGVDGSLVQPLSLQNLAQVNDMDANGKKRFQSLLFGKTLVMNARFGGLKDGLLKDDANDAPPTTDDGNEWMASGDGKPIIRFRILERGAESTETADATGKDWRESLRFDLQRNADGEVTRWLAVQKWRDTSNTEHDRAAGRPQTLTEHQFWAAEKASAIAQGLGLPQDYACALCIAARLHDEGKKAQRWQRAFRAERDARKFKLEGKPLPFLAKTRGPINQQVLDGYRHEFGSLPEAEKDAEFQKLQPDMRDLVLHLIAAHHGQARPLIATAGCEDAPPSALEERAREVALRYARLQKRWGPWGLAWWESLLRAADVQASKQNDEREES